MSAETFLLDTSIWIKYLRGLDERLKERIASLVLEGRAFTTEIVILEILRGAKSDREYAALMEDFLALPQLAADDNTWRSAWNLSYQLKKKGVTVPLADTIIAAVALRHGCKVLHSDSHYEIIAKHTALKTKEV